MYTCLCNNQLQTANCKLTSTFSSQFRYWENELQSNNELEKRSAGDVRGSSESTHQVGSTELPRGLVKFTIPPVSRERGVLGENGLQNPFSWTRRVQLMPMEHPPRSRPEIRKSNFEFEIPKLYGEYPVKVTSLELPVKCWFQMVPEDSRTF